MKTILGSRKHHYLLKLSIFLVTVALIAGIAGCSDGGGYVPPPSKDLEIRTWYDLDEVRDNLAGHHTLMNDLNSTTPGYQELAGPTANEGKGWEPLIFYVPGGGGSSVVFTGTFDGQGYEIRDLFINRPDEDWVGLFGSVDEGGVIKDVGAMNVTVIGRDTVGSLAGGIYGSTVSNSYSSGSVTGNDRVGGLAGYANRGIMTGSYFTGSVNGYESVGGLVGINFYDHTVSGSHFAGNVAGTWSVGGLVGANCGGTVTDSHASGSVTGYEPVGGLAGLIWAAGTVSDCYSTASVTGEAGVGGLVGYNSWPQWSLSEDPWGILPWPGVSDNGINVNNSYYDYDDSLINGKNIITIGALSSEDFDQWLANDKFLDIKERLSQENDYYLINDVNDFRQLLAFGQNDTLKFQLTSDINLVSEPGLYIPYLAGEFDGNGHRISNLSFNSESVYCVGLFGYLGRAGKVSQVRVENINITGAACVGGLVGQSQGTVSESYSSGTVTGKRFNVGGLVGSNTKTTWVGHPEWSSQGIVSDSSSTASVSGGYVVGGLVGSNFLGTVGSSYATGSVTGYQYVGGLVGTSDLGLGDTGNVSDSYFTGSITGEDCVGGLTGCGLGSNSYYNYDEVLINGEYIITVGALSGEDFDQWLANNKSLNVSGRLSQEEGHYLINDVNDLKQLLAVGQNASLKFRLTNDLDLAAEPNFYVPYLAGEFDGNGHRISNLSFQFEFASYVGLFGFLAPGGSITQLGDENVDVAGKYYVAGMVGFSAGNVSRSYSTGSLTGNFSVGGLVGYNLGTVSYSRSTIGVTGYNRVGGLVGWNDGGESTDGIVSKSYSAGSVTGNWGVGGLVGANYHTVDNSYSTASVTGYDYVGGLVGVGGASNSYSTGSVTGGTADVGGLAGRGGISVTNSFWDIQTSGKTTSNGGTGKTTAQMKDITTFSGATWNITAVADPGTRNTSFIWNIVDDVTYPFLSWQT
jgi:The GLUG motif